MSNLRSKFLIFTIIFFMAGLLLFPANCPAQVPDTQSAGNVVRIMDTPAEYSGWTGADQSVFSAREIRIGFFMPREGNRSVIDAADLAIDDLNRSGGYNGLPFRLVNRWAVNPWSAGSKEMIRLVYQDSVCAVIGSIDGTATHIAEQVVTKARVTLIAPLSADPTLNYINIPWMFRLPPDNNIQARLIVEQGIKEQGIKKVGLITSNDHDGKIFAEDMLDVLAGNQVNPQFHLEIPPLTADPEKIVQRIKEYRVEGLIISLSVNDIKLVLPELDRQCPAMSVFMPWLPQLPEEDIANHSNLAVYCIEPFIQDTSDILIEFTKRFRERYGYQPQAAALYTYDAITMTGMAVRISGPNRARIRENIAGLSGYSGVSGKIEWDNGGGNRTVPVLRRKGTK